MSSVGEFVSDGLIGRLSTLGSIDSRCSKRNMMRESENRSEEYKGMIRFAAAKACCVGKALHFSLELTLFASLIGI